MEAEWSTIAKYDSFGAYSSFLGLSYQPLHRKDLETRLHSSVMCLHQVATSWGLDIRTQTFTSGGGEYEIPQLQFGGRERGGNHIILHV